MNAFSGAGSVSMSDTPHRSTCTAPGMWPAAKRSAGRRSRMRSFAFASMRAASSCGTVSNCGFAKPLGMGQSYSEEGARVLRFSGFRVLLQVDRPDSLAQSMSVDVGRALDQIAQIHEQIAKGEVYRGYRSLPVAASGVIGLVAAWLQPRALGAADPIGFVIYWSVIAVCAGFVGTSEILHNYVVRDEAAGRRRTRKVVGQFLPSVAGGAAIAICFTHSSAALVPLLPGLWAICFGIGTFASRPYLPRASGYVALFYYAAGFALLWNARGPDVLNGWWIGGTFGAGQLLAAAVLWWNLERE